MSLFTYPADSLHVNVYVNDGRRREVNGATQYDAVLVLNGVQVEHGYGPDPEYAKRDLWREVALHTEVRGDKLMRVRDLEPGTRFAYDNRIYRTEPSGTAEYVTARGVQYSSYLDFYDPVTAMKAGELSWNTRVEVLHE